MSSPEPIVSDAMTAPGPKIVNHASGLRDCNANGSGKGPLPQPSFAAELIIIFETAVELEKFNRSNLLTKSQSWPSSACTKPENSYRKTLHEPLGYSRFIKPVAWVFVPCQFVAQRYLALAAQALDAFGLLLRP